MARIYVETKNELFEVDNSEYDRSTGPNGVEFRRKTDSYITFYPWHVINKIEIENEAD